MDWHGGDVQRVRDRCLLFRYDRRDAEVDISATSDAASKFLDGRLRRTLTSAQPHAELRTRHRCAVLVMLRHTCLK